MVSVIVCPNKTKKGERIIQTWVPDLGVIRFPKCIATKIAEETTIKQNGYFRRANPLIKPTERKWIGGDEDD